MTGTRDLRPPFTNTLSLAMLCFALLGPPAARAAPYSAKGAGFLVRFGEEITAYRAMAAFVMPRDTLSIEAIGAADARYDLGSSGGWTTRTGPAAWSWVAPSRPGLYAVDVVQTAPRDSIRLNVFVMVPYDSLQGEHLQGYRIGTYPAVPLRGEEIYRHPRGFVEVTEENEETLVSPHFRLKQFVAKQPAGYPRYVVLQERFLSMLELVLERVNAAGHAAETLHVMSGYRTPYYNSLIDNVPYSRHQWGDAADIFVDSQPENGVMDDLDGDGRSDFRDALALYGIIEAIQAQPIYRTYIGGLSPYPGNRAHGPFVHVDTRGKPARWGEE